MVNEANGIAIIMSHRSAPLDRLKDGLIVSCQPVSGGPFDHPPMVRAFAQAALHGGASGLLIEGVANLEAVRAVTEAPVIGLVKRDLVDSAVRITPFAEDVRALAAAGASIVAIDCTDRHRPEPLAALIEAAHRAGCLVMADVATLVEGEAAAHLGADILSSALSGHTGDEPPPNEPDLALVAALVRLARPVVAQGNIRSPEQATAARRAGAFAVCVGSAITRPELVTEWFVAALEG